MTQDYRDTRGARITKFLLCLVMSIEWSGTVSAVGMEESTFVAKAERGITGAFEFRYPGKILHVLPQREVDAPISVRLQRVNEHGATYEVRFIGNREGRFDLREYLEHVDGTPSIDLPSMPVQIVSMLPKDQRSDLFDSTVYRPRIFGGYRISWILGGLVWIAIPCCLWVIHYWRKPLAAPTIPEEKSPTIAEQLRPLIEAASHRSLSTVEKGRLELLLYHFWRERGALQNDNMANSIRKLRALPEARALFGVIETWLHSNPSDVHVDRSPELIAEILKPYQSSAVDVTDTISIKEVTQRTEQGVAR